MIFVDYCQSLSRGSENATLTKQADRLGYATHLAPDTATRSVLEYLSLESVSTIACVMHL